MIMLIKMNVRLVTVQNDENISSEKRSCANVA